MFFKKTPESFNAKKGNLVFFLVPLVLFFSFHDLRVVLKSEQLSTKITGNIAQEGTSFPRVEKGELKIGFITDAHCYSHNGSSTNYEWELNWRCSQPLNAFVKEMNDNFMPDFVVDGGDFIDGKDRHGKGSFALADQIYKKLDAPLYRVLGNHEMKSYTAEDWSREVGYERPFYSFDKKGYRIIVLDGNYRPDNGGPRHTEKGFLYYPGVIGDEEWSWLEETLASGLKKGLTNLVFVHQPPIGVDARPIEKLFVNGKKFQELLFQYHTRAIFSGHIERLCNMQIAGTDYYVIQGFWKANDRLKEEFQYKDGGVFSEITIDPSGNIEVEMFYRNGKNSKYSSLLVDENSANCLDGKSLISYEEGDYSDLEEEQDLEEDPILN